MYGKLTLFIGLLIWSIEAWSKYTKCKNSIKYDQKLLALQELLYRCRNLLLPYYKVHNGALWFLQKLKRGYDLWTPGGGLESVCVCVGVFDESLISHQHRGSGFPMDQSAMCESGLIWHLLLCISVRLNLCKMKRTERRSRSWVKVSLWTKQTIFKGFPLPLIISPFMIWILISTVILWALWELTSVCTCVCVVTERKRGTWSLVCENEEQWTRLAESIKDKTSPQDRHLFRIITQNFLPEIGSMIEHKARLESFTFLFRGLNSQYTHTNHK